MTPDEENGHEGLTELLRVAVAGNTHSLTLVVVCSYCQVGMNCDTVSIKAPKECFEKFAATFKAKFLTTGNVLRMISTVCILGAL